MVPISAAFRKVVKAAGLDPAAWTPRELRHSFVSLLSDADVPTEKIAQPVSHSSTTTSDDKGHDFRWIVMAC
jgi:integrase